MRSAEVSFLTASTFLFMAVSTTPAVHGVATSRSPVKGVMNQLSVLSVLLDDYLIVRRLLIQSKDFTTRVRL